VALPSTIDLHTPEFRLGDKEVPLTHLDRPFFPSAGYLKADVLDYYLKVAPYLLPHISRRPLTLERCPDGVDHECFYQKDASDYFPGWLETFAVERKDRLKTVHYPVVGDTADLLYLVNLGTLTFHTQMARVEDPSHPDLMVLDVDPPDSPPAPGDTNSRDAHETPFRRAVAVTLLLREHLRAAGWDPVVKTSGKRGLHLAFRLEDRLDYVAARAGLKELFDRLAAEHPDLLTTKARKAARGGRVYLDALRMSEGATIVPPYVVRATPNATVSMPVTWQELGDLDGPEDFTLRTVPARL
jgi:bifunctional non-homologous end joining protein LigD